MCFLAGSLSSGYFVFLKYQKIIDAPISNPPILPKPQQPAPPKRLPNEPKTPLVSPQQQGQAQEQKKRTPRSYYKPIATPKPQQAEKPKELTRKEKGDLFESYIAHHFVKCGDEFIDWRGDKKSNLHGRFIYPKSSTWPDLEFFNSQHQVYYAIECKWRSKWEYCERGICALKRMYEYNEYSEIRSKITPVFLALGIGGKPDNPKELYVFPIRQEWLDNGDISNEMTKEKVIKLATTYPNEVYVKDGKMKLQFIPNKDPLKTKIVSKY